MEGTFYLATADDIKARRIGESEDAVTSDMQTVVKLDTLSSRSFYTIPTSGYVLEHRQLRLPRVA
jgi:hypothetical protein